MDERVDGRTRRYAHRRPELLTAVTEYLLERGGVDVGLRTLAADIGITHATLIRHFGTKDRLWELVLAELRARLVRSLDDEVRVLGAVPVPVLLRAVWQRLSEPAEQRQFLVLFELVGRVARDKVQRAALSGVLVGDLVEVLAGHLRRDGVDGAEARVRATTLLGVVRGLQLDLILTGDRERVDAAFDRIVTGIASTGRPDPG